MSIKNKKLKIMNEEWREAVMTEKCYFCHLLSFEFTSLQEFQHASKLEFLNSSKLRKLLLLSPFFKQRAILQQLFWL
jgi:hypothetical protein